MLTLILGTDWVANRDAVLERLRQDVKHSRGNRILMVPELISHDMERRLCEAAGDTTSRYAEVLSFTRLADRVSDSVGSAAMQCLDNGGRVVAMAAAARQLYSKLKAYASVETRPEFLTGLVDAVDEFKRCCIGAQDLKQASLQTEGSFAQKLEELSLLLEAYDSLCSRGKRDPRDQMTWLLEQLADSDFAERHVFYIDGFPDFTRQHLGILEYLIRVSPSVTVSLNTDRPGSTLMAFEKAGLTAAELIQCAQKAGVDYEITNIREEGSDLHALKMALFQGKLPIKSIPIPQLRLGHYDCVYEECRGAAHQVMQLVSSGSRYRDIGIVCTDMGNYRNALHMVFERCGIPVYLSGTEEILEKSVITTVLTAMDAALGGFERQDVLRYLKSVLSPLSQEEGDLLENYSILWGINGQQWLNPWVHHPEGLGKNWTEGAQRRLERLNASRKAAIEPLRHLRDGFRKATKIKDQIIALYAFFQEIQLSKSLKDLADTMDAQGDNRSAQILNQLWEILICAVEQLYDILGETVWDNATFTRLFTLLLSQYNVGTIPTVLDAVTAGPVGAMRCHQVKHLILLGAQEGLLPGYGGSSGILTDQERVTLRQLGVPLTGGSMEGLQAEFAEIYGVFCGARESVSVSYSEGQPSYLYRRMEQMSNQGEDKTTAPPVLDTVDAAVYLARQEAQDTAKHLGVLELYQDVLRRCRYTLGTIQREHIHTLYGKKLQLSASQIDRQAECRFSYFMKYGLRAQERQEAQVDPAEFGTYVHAVLEHTARDVMALGGFHQVSLEQTMEIAMEHSRKYAQERFQALDSKRMVYLFQRNIQELAMVVRELWMELSTSEFAPVDFEVGFGDGQQMAAIEIPGGAVEAQLRGFVDRVDAWNNGSTNYFRVVDYKTGKKDFDYCDVFNGIGLQMLLYLFALKQQGQPLLGEHPVPVGVQYFPARSPVLSVTGAMTSEEAEMERGKVMKRKGLVLSDEAVLAAMEPENAPKRLSCKRGKDGSLTGDVADRQQLLLLEGYVFHTLKNMVDEIVSGNVEPNPYTRGSSHDACRFCPYQEVCHFATVSGRRNYKSMTAQRFWEELGKERKSDV